MLLLFPRAAAAAAGPENKRSHIGLPRRLPGVQNPRQQTKMPGYYLIRVIFLTERNGPACR
jgi:hypothetical protein